MSKRITVGCGVNQQNIIKYEPGIVHKVLICTDSGSGLVDIVAKDQIKEAGLKPFRTDRGNLVFLLSKQKEGAETPFEGVSKYTVFGSLSNSYTLSLKPSPHGYHLKISGRHGDFQFVEMLLADLTGIPVLSVEHETKDSI